MEYSKVSAIFVIAFQLGPMAKNKVDIHFETQEMNHVWPQPICNKNNAV
jgi:hypothetical protein